METSAETVFRIIPEIRRIVMTELWIQKHTGMSTEFMMDTFHKKGHVVTIMKPNTTINFRHLPPSMRLLPPSFHGQLGRKCIMLTDTGDWKNYVV